MIDPVPVRWVHCEAHGSPHVVKACGGCWCSLIPHDPQSSGYGYTLLETTGYAQTEAAEECRVRGLWLFHNWARVV